ncbi:MAG: SmpA / OmlA family protein [Alphaproteobacteria bacterium ADurb.Bin438]|nr:MAG: SmpA / OmlA family protein [Alphaproteobacteria bacterium ADurb.Bin438]
MASCAQVEIRGNLPEKVVLNEISIGMHKSEVTKLIGSPSIVPAFSDDVWVYIGGKLNKKAFFDAKEEQRQAVYIKFNYFGRVQDIEVKEISDGMNVAFSKDKTKSLGQNYGIIKQLIGNIGRFNPDLK